MVMKKLNKFIGFMRFLVLQDKQGLSRFDDWSDCTKFNCAKQIVEKDGRAYRIVVKKECTLSYLEQISLIFESAMIACGLQSGELPYCSALYHATKDQPDFIVDRVKVRLAVPLEESETKSEQPQQARSSSEDLAKRMSYPLHNAFSDQHKRKNVLSLIEKGEWNSMQDGEGNAPIHLAVSQFNLGAVEALIEKGVNINAQNNQGMSPLHFLARGSWHESDENNLMNLIGILTDYDRSGIDLADNDGNTPLHIAVKSGQYEIVSKLVELGASMKVGNNQRDTALHLAIKLRQGRITDFLIKSGASFNVRNEKGETPFFLYCHEPRFSSEKMVDFMVEKGVDNTVNVDGQTALGRIWSKRYWDSGFKLLKRGAPIDTKNEAGNTALHSAILDGALEVVEKLIKLGAPLNAVNESGDTPLHTVAKANVKNNGQICRLLVAAGADQTIQNSKKKTPLQVAKAENTYCRFILAAS